MLITFSLGLHAQTLSSCFLSGENYGSQSGTPTSINPACADLILNTGDHLTKDFSSDELIEVTGKNNILIVRINALDGNNNPVFFADEFTSGEKSKLSNIQAVDFNEGDSRVYVLNQSNDGKKQVYSYQYDVGGNNTPLRELVTDDIEEASNLRINGEETLLISSNAKWLRVFNGLADPDGKKSENSNNILREISGSNTLFSSPNDLVIYNSEIFILDNDRVLVFNLTDSGDIAPKRNINGSNTQLSGAKRIEINSSNELVITNSDGSKKRFNINANGNVNPL